MPRRGDRKPDVERFTPKITVLVNGCWAWTAKKTPNGYGQFTVGYRAESTQKLVYAHRWVYEQVYGSIPLDYEIDHLCRNRLCVNPYHLEAVTHSVNVLRGDMPKIRRNRTHCPHGHPYIDGNIYWTKNGDRTCATCVKRRSLARYYASKSYYETSLRDRGIRRR